MSTRSIERAALVLKRDLTLGTLFDRLEKVHGDRQLVDRGRRRARPHLRAGRPAGPALGRRASPRRPSPATSWSSPPPTATSSCSSAAPPPGPARIPAPVNDQMRKDEIAHVVADSGATLVLQHRRRRSTTPSSHRRRRTRRRPTTSAALFYTSGTTGTAQGRRAHATGRSSGRWPARRSGRLASTATRPSSPCRWPTSWGSPCSSGSAVAGIPCLPAAEVQPGEGARRHRGAAGDDVRRRAGHVPDARRGRTPPSATSPPCGCGRPAPTPCRPSWPSGSRRWAPPSPCPLLGAVGEAAFAEGYGMVEVGGGVAAKVSPPFLGAGPGPLGEALGFAAARLRDARRRRRRAPSAGGARSASCR